jgi:thioredoxin reductase (NADPH)
MTDKIENYPGTGPQGASGAELSRLMEEQAKAMGATIISDQVKSVLFSDKTQTVELAYLESIESRALIIATGRDAKKIGIKGEEEYLGRGVSYCAICDGAFFRDKDVAVIGGGNSALEEALYLTKIAKSVAVIHRRQGFRADQIVVDRLMKHPKVKVILDHVPVSVSGEGVMQAIMIENVITKKQQTLPMSAMFIYIGNTPNTSFLSEQVILDGQGYIMTDDAMRTSRNNVFAAGDVRQKTLYQVVTATADGAIAAMQANAYLSEQDASS